MANIARLKTWNLNETLTSADLNTEFDNILSGTNNGSLDSDNIDQTDTYTWSGNHTFNSLVTHGANLTVGVDDTGHDVQFFGATSGAHFLWDESADTLKMVGGAKINAQGTVTVGVDDTGYDVKFFGATTGKYMLWDEAEDTLAVVGTAITLNGTAVGDASVGTANTWTADQTFNDNVKVTLGTGGDADFYYDGTNVVLNTAVVGSGVLSMVGSMAMSNAAGPTIVNEAATATNPTIIPNQAEVDTGLGWAAADTLTLITGGTERMRVDSSGRVGIGNTTPGTYFAGPAQLTIGDTGSSEAALVLAAGTSAAGSIYFTDTADTANQAYISYGHTANTMTFATNSSNAMTINSSGAVNVIGALSKGSGSFKIRHPLEEKEGYDLVHSFVEAPQADLIYRGMVDLVDGAATVNIDTAGRMTEGTFEALCTNVQSFTSNESNDDCVRGSVVGNILTITSSNAASTASISWMVIGERKDQHMIDTEWTDENGRVITEPLTETREVVV